MPARSEKRPAARRGGAKPGQRADGPIERLVADHRRVQQICRLLDALARDIAGASRATAASIADFLRREFPRHAADEDDLVRLLEPRLFVGDEVDEALRELSKEHAADGRAAIALADALAAFAEGKAADSAALAALAGAFAEAQRRHMAWENLALLPIARARLTAADLAALGAAMKCRRAEGDEPAGRP
jgi:hemerythrin-like domain-containing protein